MAAVVSIVVLLVVSVDIVVVIELVVVTVVVEFMLPLLVDCRYTMWKTMVIVVVIVEQSR